MRRSTTLQTIADEVGVSRTTVSNAFNRPNQLSPKLRAKILAAAERLSYQGPNPAAQVLRRGRSSVLGVLMCESLDFALSDPYYVNMLRGLVVGAETDGMSVLLLPSNKDKLRQAHQAVMDYVCMATMPDDDPLVLAVLERGLPTVFIDQPKIAGQGYVGIDDAAAMGDVIDRLVAQGHQHIAVFSYIVGAGLYVGPIDKNRLAHAERVCRERIGGAVARLSAHGLEPAVLYEVGWGTREEARREARHVLAGPNRPSAIVCLSDKVALGVLDGAADQGIAVPDELSVTGFDDIAAAAGAGLTTVRQPSYEKGRAAWDLLQAGRTDHMIMPHQLVERATTGGLDKD